MSLEEQIKELYIPYGCLHKAANYLHASLQVFEEMQKRGNLRYNSKAGHISKAYKTCRSVAEELALSIRALEREVWETNNPLPKGMCGNTDGCACTGDCRR